MAVEISGAPTPVENPAFAGLTVRVPLSEAPTKVWLDLLALEELPGKGHRLGGEALEFHLDRDSHDVSAAMRKVSKAISGANAKYAVYGQQLEAGATRAEHRHAASVEKISRQLEDWWGGEHSKDVPEIASAQVAERGEAQGGSSA
jgi:hypothetical protein